MDVLLSEQRFDELYDLSLDAVVEFETAVVDALQFDVLNDDVSAAVDIALERLNGSDTMTVLRFAVEYRADLFSHVPVGLGSMRVVDGFMRVAGEDYSYAV